MGWLCDGAADLYTYTILLSFSYPRNYKNLIGLHPDMAANFPAVGLKLFQLISLLLTAALAMCWASGPPSGTGSNTADGTTTQYSYFEKLTEGSNLTREYSLSETNLNSFLMCPKGSVIGNFRIVRVSLRNQTEQKNASGTGGPLADGKLIAILLYSTISADVNLFAFWRLIICM